MKFNSVQLDTAGPGIMTGSISSRLGDKITLDELALIEPTTVDAMRQHLADLHGVPVDSVHLQCTHMKGDSLIGDFIVRKP